MIDLEKLYEKIAQECGVSVNEVKNQIEQLVQGETDAQPPTPTHTAATKKRSVEDFVSNFILKKESE